MSEMAEPGPRAKVLDRIDREHQAWRALVDEVGRERMAEPGPMGEWTFKDLVAHLVGWRRRTIARFDAAAAGREEPAPPWPADLDDDEVINDWIHDQNRGRSLDDILEEADRSYDRLAEAIAAIPEAKITDPDAFPGLAGQALADADLFGHLNDEHLPSIRAWLAHRA
jgi:hypothetical protein